MPGNGLASAGSSTRTGAPISASSGVLATKELIATFTGDEVYHGLEGKTHFKLDLGDAEALDLGGRSRRWQNSTAPGLQARSESLAAGKDNLLAPPSI